MRACVSVCARVFTTTTAAQQQQKQHQHHQQQQINKYNNNKYNEKEQQQINVTTRNLTQTSEASNTTNKQIKNIY